MVSASSLLLHQLSRALVWEQFSQNSAISWIYSQFFLPNDPSIFCISWFFFQEADVRRAHNVLTFLVCGREAFIAQEKQLENSDRIYSLLSCCPSLVNILDTSRICGSSQSTVSWRLFNSKPQAFLLWRSLYTTRKLMSTIFSCLSRNSLYFSFALYVSW